MEKHEIIKRNQLSGNELLIGFRKFEDLQRCLKQMVDNMNKEKNNGNLKITKAKSFLRKITQNKKKN